MLLQTADFVRQMDAGPANWTLGNYRRFHMMSVKVS
jgi:hypothetical protein